LPSVTAPYGTAPDGSTTIFIVSQIAAHRRDNALITDRHDIVDVALDQGKIRRAEISPQSIGNRIFLFLINEPMLVE